MNLLLQLANNAQQLNVPDLFNGFFSKRSTQDLIVKLQTEEQLFKGFDSTGKELEEIGGGYTPITIEIKISKGQPFDRVTLKDSGAFYRSFTVEVGSGFITLDADTIKDGEDLQNRWGINIIGLNEQNNAIIQRLFLAYIQEETRKNLCKNL